MMLDTIIHQKNAKKLNFSLLFWKLQLTPFPGSNTGRLEHHISSNLVEIYVLVLIRHNYQIRAKNKLKRPNISDSLRIW